MKVLIVHDRDYALDDDDRACLRMIGAEVVQSGAEALIAFRGADPALIAWARRAGLRVFDWRESGPLDARQV